MKIKFYTVSDCTMAYKVLLGRDFLKCPSLRVTLGDIVEIENIEETSIKRNVNQILSISTIENLNSTRDKLQIKFCDRSKQD